MIILGHNKVIKTSQDNESEEVTATQSVMKKADKMSSKNAKKHVKKMIRIHNS